MAITTDLPAMPFSQPDLLRIAPEYLRLQREAPLARVRTPAGDPAWLAVGHAEVKALLADPRLGRSHREPDRAARMSASALLGGPVGEFDTEPLVHGHVRAMLAPAFTAKKVERLTARTDELAGELLAELPARPQPVDLHEHVSARLPLLVIADILGISSRDIAPFAEISGRLANAVDPAVSASAQRDMFTLMSEVIAAKRADPGEDLITGLIAAAGDNPIGTRLITSTAASLFFAGQETVSSRLDFGVLLLLEHARDTIETVTSPAAIGRTVEEILRLATPNDYSQGRYARDDIEIGGVVIAEGEAVVLGIGAANRDPAVFADPERVDFARNPNPHLTFGHGRHFCLGAQLARLELRAVLPRLFHRFPALRVAEEHGAPRLNAEQVTGGITALPVRW